MQQVALLVAIPLLGAFLLPSLAKVQHRVALLTAPLLLLGLLWWAWCLPELVETSAISVAIGNFLPPLGINFYVDQLALWLIIAMLVMTLLIWPLLGNESVQQHSMLLVMIAAASGIVLSGDIFNIYVFYELLSVASFGLVMAARTGAAYAATLRYLVVSGLGSVLALTGIALLYTQTGTLNLADLADPDVVYLRGSSGLAAFVLILLGLGVKAEIFPLNQWVAEVYAAANSRIAALMAGVISKIVLLVILRLLIVLFPYPEAYQVLMVLGILGVIFGEVAAWRSQDLTRMLAYSSIGQLGLIFIAAAIPGEAGILAAVALALHHMLVKPALFLLAERWGGAITNLRGLVTGSPLMTAIFVLLLLSLLGIPPLPGFWAKLLLITGLGGVDSQLAALALATVALATVIEANYLFNVVRIMFANNDITAATPVSEPHRLTSQIALLLIATVIVVASFQITTVGTKLQQITVQASDRQHYIAVVKPELQP